jgi:hypothetical protein
MLRRIVGLESEGIIGEWEKSEINRNVTVLFFIKSYYGDQIKACEFVGRSERIRPLARPTRVCEFSKGRSVNISLFCKICIDLPLWSL